MLIVVVQPFVQNGMFGFGIFKKQKISAPNSASGTEPRRMMNGSRKLLNSAASTRKISTTARMNAGRNLSPSVALEPRIAGVIQLVAAGQHFGAFAFQKIAAPVPAARWPRRST